MTRASRSVMLERRVDVGKLGRRAAERSLLKEKRKKAKERQRDGPVLVVGG